jgi:hypothetical protein
MNGLKIPLAVVMVAFGRDHIAEPWMFEGLGPCVVGAGSVVAR